MHIKQQYAQNGVIGPIKLMSRDDALRYKQKLLEADACFDLMNSDYRCKSNVLFTWIDEITRNPHLIEVVSQLIGPNFHCWDTLLWIKKAGGGKDVSYHQDSTYWNFDKPEKALTVWFAFDDVTEEHGPLEYIIGSHHSATMHEDIKTDSNLLMRGQTVADLDAYKKLPRAKMTVPAGCALVHGPHIIHGSGINKASTDRIAMGMLFVSTECKPVLDKSPESTVMVSGEDKYNYMLHDPRPTGDWETDVKNWKAAYDRQHDNYYWMQQRCLR